jgi:hypothetical protein
MGWTCSLVEELLGEGEGSWELKRLGNPGIESCVTAGFRVDGKTEPFRFIGS